MADLLDFVPDEDRELIGSDAEQILAADRGSDWLVDDPAGDDDYDRGQP
jgi:hypothetical protein